MEFEIANSPWLTKSPIQIEAERKFIEEESEELTEHCKNRLERMIGFGIVCV